MQSESSNLIPISPKDLEPFKTRASQLLSRVSFKPGRKAQAQLDGGAQASKTEYRELSLSSAATEETQSLLAVGKAVSNEALLLSDASNHVLNAISEGLCISMHLMTQFAKASGLDTLTEQNKSRRLTDSLGTEFQNKNTTAAAIGTFALASYVKWKLEVYEEQKVSAVKMLDVDLVELTLATPTKAIDCSLFYLGVYLTTSGLVQTDIQMVKATIKYFEAVIKDIQFKQKSFGYLELFTDMKYRLVDTPFTVQGFQEMSAASVVVQEFNKVSFSDMAGNRRAIHEGKRMAQRLVAYDPSAKNNPFNMIGGFQSVRLGYGPAGTGKTLLIGAEATLIEQYCEMIGLKFTYHPIPGAMVSSFQGASEEKMEIYLRKRHETDGVIYMPADDVEQLFEDRTRQGVSEGAKGIISATLRGTEGASAPKFGNSVMTWVTNLPEVIDPAINSRAQCKFLIEGAVEIPDFMFQDYLWYRELQKIDAEFVNMLEPKDGSWLKTQGDVVSISQLIVPGNDQVDDERIKEALAIADKNHDRSEHAFFARLYAEVKRRYPRFTSRDLRNIQTAISARINDFDMPEDWFNKPDTFFRQSFDRKVEMLKELMKGNMKGLTFKEVRFQETMTYLGTLANIANIDRERKIAQAIDALDIQQEALKRHKVLRG